MEKQKLVDFIEKTNLGGKIDQAVLTIKKGKIKTDFVSPQGSSMVGFVEKQGIDMADGVIGVANIYNFKKLLNIMDDDIEEIRYGWNGDIINEVTFKDNHTEVGYVSANPSVIARAPEIKDIPDTDIEIVLDDYLIANFIKGKNALNDIKTFTIVPHKKSVKFVIGYSNILSNTVSFDAKCNKFNKIEKLTFDAELFKEILASNKGAKKSSIEVSGEGLMTIKFEDDDYNAQYYLVCKDED